MKVFLNGIKKSVRILFKPVIGRIRLKQDIERWEGIIDHYNSLKEDDYSDELKKIYEAKFGVELCLDNPVKYTEKIQWRKIYDRNPLYSKLADKYTVREWVSRKIGSEYLIPLLGTWNSFEEIDFDRLPDAFVLKTNNSSKTNIIIKDKKAMDLSLERRKMNLWLKTSLAANNLELHYLKIKPCILAEVYISPEKGKSDIEDYKFLCFYGEPRYCWVDIDRSDGHKRNVYDMNWNLQEWTVGKNPSYSQSIPKPQNFEKMIDLSRRLSKGFAHVRVDLYDVAGKIYFGEMTFTSGAGFEGFTPREMDMEIGSLWDIHSKQVEEEIVLS